MMDREEYLAHVRQLGYVPQKGPKQRKKKAEPESGLQIACVHWFRTQYKPLENLLFAIPNGGHRNKVVAAKLKMEGVLPGVPDLQLALPRGRFHGLFIEMKVKYATGKKNYSSPEQKKRVEELLEQGYQVVICYELNEFIVAINDYLNL
ncbi:VRR-NUC domain-containing protein [Tellurirhabdus bombi]|uniref:VRR-NUC domain-containing protein n=1 Tax=Tellurirhabdus bombi TaxID=2907205 RepID=UPI001F17847C|nr:VRR-NUC domain-containing protein [Tellurirhabdus bombi]